MLKNIIFAIGGLAAGSVATYFLSKKKLENDAYEQAQKEIEEMRKHYDEKRKELAEQYENHKKVENLNSAKADFGTKKQNDISSEQSSKSSKESKSGKTSKTDNTSKTCTDDDEQAKYEEKVSTYTNYSRKSGEVEKPEMHVRNLFDNKDIFKEINDEIDEENGVDPTKLDQNPDWTPLYPTEGLPQDPYQIDYDQFSDERPEFEKETLYFLSKVNMVVDEEEDPIENPEYLLGDDFRKILEETDDDTIYIRNEKSGADYMIIEEYREYLGD